MNKQVLKRSLIFFVIISITLFSSLCNFQSNFTKAADLLRVSDTMSHHTINELSNHTISFRTPSGVHAPAATITITIDSNFNTAGVLF